MNATPVRFVVGMVALWATLAVMAEFDATGDIAVALAWAIAAGVEFAYGNDALTEVERLVGS